MQTYDPENDYCIEYEAPEIRSAQRHFEGVLTMTTKHSHGPNFGNLVDTCPRCQELKNGAPAVKWSGTLRKEQEARLIQDIKNHDCKKSGCMLVCTAFDW
jgi:hypothetical protein